MKKKSASTAKRKAASKGRRLSVPGPPRVVGGRPELIVVPRDDARRYFVGDTAPSFAPERPAPFQHLLQKTGARFVPIHPRAARGVPGTGMKGLVGEPPGAPKPVRFFHVDAPREHLPDLHKALKESGMVSAAYLKPPSTVPVINTMMPAAAPAPRQTPDFSEAQGYLADPLEGVGARTCWTHPGGKGAGVQVIDLEWAWEIDHEDLRQNKQGVLGGAPNGNTDHGTAVTGVIAADENAFGVTGISPAVSLGMWAFDSPTSQAIEDAALRLAPGDIMLLEIHRPGPAFRFEEREDQLGYVAIEWWPDDLEAIQFAVSRGIIVVEAAGNGAENLDDSRYQANPDFPVTWQNPYASAASGAIVVGAGAPPPNTHGNDHGPDRSRLDFSNYGSRLDAQGWGREVTTTGYGDLQGGDVRRYYTNQFSGTSSASPIVVGALACVQSRLAQAGLPKLTPEEARAALRATGSAQQAAPGRPASQRIGNRPSIADMVAWAQQRRPPPRV